MRKHFLLILMMGLFFCFPFIVFAKDDVHISDVEVEEKSFGTEEIKEVAFNHLDLSLKLNFTNVNDYIRYKVTIRNDTDKDYELEHSNDGFQNSEYILYQVEFDDDSDVIKAKSDKVVYITASYMKEVDNSNYVNGKFVEKKDLGIHLSNGSNTVNPNTGTHYFLLGIGIIISLLGIGLVISNHKYLKTVCGLYLFGILLLPVLAYAVETLTLHIDSEVEISYMKEFCYIDELANPSTIYIEFEPGTIMNDYLAEHSDLKPMRFNYHEGRISKTLLNEKLSTLTNGEYTDFLQFEDVDEYYDYYATLSDEDRGVLQNLYYLYFNNYTYVFENNGILDKSFGCYERLYK